MKSVLVGILVILSYQLYPQQTNYSGLPFIRVYNFEGEKIYKGKAWKVTDTSLVLISNKQKLDIPVSEIATIKTKHSAGSNILVGAIIGAATMGVVGFTTAEPDAMIFAYSQGEGALIGAFVGAAGGSIIGWITSLFKKPVTYQIAGNAENLQQFQLEQL